MKHGKLTRKQWARFVQVVIIGGVVLIALAWMLTGCSQKPKAEPVVQAEQVEQVIPPIAPEPEIAVADEPPAEAQAEWEQVQRGTVKVLRIPPANIKMETPEIVAARCSSVDWVRVVGYSLLVLILVFLVWAFIMGVASKKRKHRK